jgi:hypothetical protein
MWLICTTAFHQFSPFRRSQADRIAYKPTFRCQGEKPTG